MEPKSIWEYIHGNAPHDSPNEITFYDYQDDTLYRNVTLQTIGGHGWELVSVFYMPSKQRYEYFFKRDRSRGYAAGLSTGNTN